MKIRIVGIAFLISFTMIFCKEYNQNNLVNTEWYEVQKTKSGFVFVCDDNQRKITIDSHNSISLILYEKNSYPITKIVKTKSGYELNFKNVSWKYKFKWIDKDKGIAKWEYLFNGVIDKNFSYYTVLKANSNFSYIEKADCKKELIDDSKNYDLYSNFNNLSDKFNYIITGINVGDDDYEIKINVINKNNSQTEIVEFTPNLLNKNFKFIAKSYLFETKINENIENPNNFIISDYNFDGLEDFAILFDIGGNSGPLYSYFLQNRDGTFTEDEKFPLYQSVFPVTIDKNSKSLITETANGCCKIKTIVYQLSIKGWNVTSSEKVIENEQR